MNWKSTRWISSLLFFAILLCACERSEYTRRVHAELEKGVRYDSVLLGIKLGDTKDEFYGKCFDLNKRQLVSQGPENMSVRYMFTDSLVHNEPTEIQLLFYPSFDKDDKISNMDIVLSYSAWALWNPKYQSDSLKVKAMDLLVEWYKGNEFVTAKVGEEEIPVKLDGNRRMLVFIKDNQSVLVRVQDILHPKFKHSIDK